MNPELNPTLEHTSKPEHASKKVAIVGTGLVGSAIANALALRGSCDELLLIDKDGSRAAGQALDILDAAALTRPLEVHSGVYEGLTGAGVVVLALGMRVTESQPRAVVLERNETLFREVIPQVLKYAPDAILIVASQPVDRLTALTAELVGEVGRSRVMGVGTVLETAQLRIALARRLKIHPRHVHGYVLGEEGTAALVAWSGVHIAGVPLEIHVQQRNIPWNTLEREEVTDEVRRSSIRAARGKGAISFGVAAAVARLVEAVLTHSREIYTVTAPVERYGVSVALPRIIGRHGVEETLQVPLEPGEQQALENVIADLRRQSKVAGTSF